jgi:prophage antirepressor-like protein
MSDKKSRMLPSTLVNEQLGYEFHFWDGIKKNERIYIASEVMKQLGYKGGNKTLVNYELEDGVDMITPTKKQFPDFFKQLGNLKLLGQRAGSVILLYESGINKLIIGSKKPIGVLTRNWLAREVLPSIKEKGYYSMDESAANPMSYLFPHTENKIQIDNSKTVNGIIFNTDGDYRAYHNTVHKLVNGMTAAEIRTFYNDRGSARAILRKHLPWNAATESMIDELYIKYRVDLKRIEESGLHETMPPALKSLYDLGVHPWDDENNLKPII